MGCNRRLACVALVLVGFQSSRAADADRNLPNGAGVVLSINVEQLVNSPVGRKYLRPAIDQALNANRSLQGSFKQLELDPFRDISRVILVLSQNASYGLVIVHGKFDRDRIAKLAEQLAGEKKVRLRIHKDAGMTIYERAESADTPIFATFPNDRTLLLSNDKETLRTSNRKGEPKKELATLIQHADDRLTAWLVALPAIAKSLPIENAKKRKSLESLENLTGTLNVYTGARLDLRFASKTPQDAESINQIIVDFKNLFKSLAPGVAKEKPELAPLFELVAGLTSSVRGKIASVTVDLSAAQIEKIVKTLSRDKN